METFDGLNTPEFSDRSRGHSNVDYFDSEYRFPLMDSNAAFKAKEKEAKILSFDSKYIRVFFTARRFTDQSMQRNHNAISYSPRNNKPKVNTKFIDYSDSMEEPCKGLDFHYLLSSEPSIR